MVSKQLDASRLATSAKLDESQTLSPSRQLEEGELSKFVTCSKRCVEPGPRFLFVDEDLVALVLLGGWAMAAKEVALRHLLAY